MTKYNRQFELLVVRQYLDGDGGFDATGHELSFPRISDTSSCCGQVISGTTIGAFCCHVPLLDGGRQVAQCCVQSLAVVEADDVVSDIIPGLGMICVLALPDTFHLEVQKKAFGDGVDAPISRSFCCS